MTVAFVTPGLIDMRSFTVMGFNAKPNSSSPIGFFGTGLKYAVAVCCRIGATVTVYRGLDRYDFVQRDVDFRGKGFKQVAMRAEKWRVRARTVDLPFTTEYGKNWKPWMVFRELCSNTVDEGGEVSLVPSAIGFEALRDEYLRKDRTVILVTHVDVDKAYAERGDIFTRARVIAESAAVKVRDGGGKVAYYRGVRAKELVEPALFTYDFSKQQALTEDRTFEHEYYLREDVARFAACECEDEAVVERIVTAPEGAWEHNLDYSRHWTPSDAFKRVMSRRPRAATASAYRYYSAHVVEPEAASVSPWSAAKRPWRLDGDCVVDADGNPLFDRPYNFVGIWERIGVELVRVGNVVTVAPPAADVGAEAEAEPSDGESAPELETEVEVDGFDRDEIPF